MKFDHFSAKFFEANKCAIFYTDLAFETDRGIQKDAKRSHAASARFSTRRVCTYVDSPDKNHAHEGGVHKLWRPPCLSRGVPIGRAKKQESIPRLSAPTHARISPPNGETARSEIRHFSWTIWKSSGESFRGKTSLRDSYRLQEAANPSP